MRHDKTSTVVLLAVMGMGTSCDTRFDDEAASERLEPADVRGLLCEGEGVVANRTVVVSGTSFVTGEVAAGASITVSGGSLITGSAMAPAITRSGGGRVDGPVVLANPGIQPVNVLETVNAACTGYVNGPIGLTDLGKLAVKDRKLVLSGGDGVDLPAGRYCFDSVVASGGSSYRLGGSVELFVRSTFDASGGSFVGTGSLLVVSAKDAKLSGSSDSVSAGYLSGGKVEASGASTAQGTRIRGNDVVVSGGSRINTGGFCDEEPPACSVTANDDTVFGLSFPGGVDFNVLANDTVDPPDAAITVSSYTEPASILVTLLDEGTGQFHASADGVTDFPQEMTYTACCVSDPDACSTATVLLSS